ncbi:MAG: hypothetical protein SFU98_21280 [Leptospiraceae bacterium]|nr:hypothetical protein [Leptospiraceae bacterium]
MKKTILIYLFMFLITVFLESKLIADDMLILKPNLPLINNEPNNQVCSINFTEFIKLSKFDLSRCIPFEDKDYYWLFDFFIDDPATINMDKINKKYPFEWFLKLTEYIRQINIIKYNETNLYFSMESNRNNSCDKRYPYITGIENFIIRNIHIITNFLIGIFLKKDFLMPNLFFVQGQMESLLNF